MEGVKRAAMVSDRSRVVTEIMGVRIVSLLLITAAISVFVLWSVNPIGAGSESTFALFLAVDLVSVAMISYVERALTRGARLGRVPLVSGCCFILFLVIACFYLSA